MKFDQMKREFKMGRLKDKLKISRQIEIDLKSREAQIAIIFCVVFLLYIIVLFLK